MFKEILFIFYITVLVTGHNENDIFPSLPVGMRKSENIVCKQHSESYFENLRNFTLWAYEMRDASAKSATSVLRGSVYNMGDFTQCLSSRAPFPTQYCLISITANVPEPKAHRNPFSLDYDPSDYLLDKLHKYEDISKQSRNVGKMGWCVPASCTYFEMEKYLNEYFHEIDYPLKNQNITYTIQVPQILCTASNAPKSLDSADIIFCILTIILVSLLLSATCCEYTQEPEKSVTKSLSYRMFMAFSARKNFSDLSKTESHDEALSILHGMKVFSIFMVILDHRFGTFVSSAVSNFDYIEKSYRNTMVSYIFHGDLFVDTFFVISGLLVVYTLLNLFNKRSMNPGFIIFMRYLRLTPAYAFVIFFACTLFYHIGNGALWNAIVGTEVSDCRRNWWTNLLYISNYIHTEHMCLPHTWYLPCDLHYYILAIGLVLLIKKEKKYGLAILFAFTIISILIPFSLILIYKRPAFLRFFPDFLQAPKVHEDYTLLYIHSHTRAAPYFIGMFAGYIYHKQKKSGRVLSQCYSTSLVFISVFLLLVCMFSGVVFYDPNHGYNALESAIYGALHRAIWSLGTFGFMYATSFGTYTFLQKCLAWNPWIPLSKLVYGAYLWHFIFQMRAAAKVNNPLVFSFFDMIIYGMGDICLAFMLALGLYLLVEAPVKRILKDIFLPSKPKENDSKPNIDLHVTRENSRL